MSENRFGILFWKTAFAYSAASVMLIALEFLAASLLILALSGAAGSLYAGETGPPERFYDAAGFAVLTVANSVAQYYLGCMLALSRLDRAGRYAAAGLAAAAACGFFVAIARASAFGAYSLAWFPPLLSFVIGCLVGLAERPENNPFSGSRFNFLR